MHFTAFETNYCLQAIGLCMLHSLWQTALLCMVYFTLIHPNKNISATFKYNIAMLLLALATVWFVVSTMHHYYLLTNSQLLAVDNLNQYLQKYLQQYTYYTPYLATLYLTTISIYLCKMVYPIFNTKKPKLVKPTAAIKLFTKQAALLLGIKKNVQIWVSASIDVPQVKGLLQPIILLPITIASNLNSQQIEAIILHELAHVKRNDFALYLLQLVAKTILLFNPFAQLLHKAINNQREYSCDDLVLHFKYNKNEYATALYLLEKNRHQTIALSLAATNSKNGLLQRIKRIVEPSTIEPKKNILWPYCILAIGCGICLLMYRPIVCGNKPLVYYIINKSVYFKSKLPNTAATRKNEHLIISTPAVPNNFFATIPLKYTTIAEPKKVNKTLPQIVLLNKNWLTYKQNKVAVYTTKVLDEAFEEDEASMQSLVKIEEEQSGSNNKILYYFEVNNVGGKPVITPIYLATTPKNKSKRIKKALINTGIAY